MGETASQTLVISNPGTGTADNVQIEVVLPAGLESRHGNRLSMPIGALAAGESQTIRLGLLASQSGPQPIAVEAVSGEFLKQTAATTVFVASANLQVASEGPSLRYVGRDAAYRTRVTNDGAAAANNVRVVQAVPAGFTFVRADKSGRFDATSSQIVWFLGRLEAGQSVELSAELAAAKLGAYRNTVTVYGEQGIKAEATVQTEVEGTASLVVEIIDLNDPIEVGAETGYEVRVRNEGTKAARGVDVACRIPAGVTLTDAKGPTPHRPAGEVLAFAPLDELEPGKAAIYRVTVRGTAPGNHRFSVRLTSEGLTEPLVYEEVTKFYAD